jgi:peptidyl-prolyl cis-trans isomerase SurA
MRTVVLLCLCVAAQAELLDRIAVSVGSQVITQRDVEREIRLVAFENREKPDFSPQNKRRTAERMVDQRLVRRELEMNRYHVPSTADMSAPLEEVKRVYANQAAYQQSLEEYGITEEELKDWLVWQATLVRFIDIRFRPGIQITDEQIADFEKAHPAKGVAEADYRAQIASTLMAEAANQQAEEWLVQARKRTRIAYHEEVFE